MEISHIHGTSAQHGYNELLNALGTENNSSQWLIFMNAAQQHLPFLLEPGRPTKQQIENSMIGQLGFKSWSEMVEASQNNQGLNWSINSWKQWSKAFKVVSQYSYLTEMDLTASSVMTLQSMFKDVDFPSDAENLKLSKAALEENKKKDEADKVANLKQLVVEVEKQLAAANAKVEMLFSSNEQLTQLIDDVATLKSENMQLVARNEDLNKKSGEREHSARIQKKELDALKSRVDLMSAWDYFKKIFTG